MARIDPITHPGYYLNPLLGGKPFPGPIVKNGIRGLKNAEGWTIVRAIAGQGWVANHTGRKPIEGIEVEISLNAADDEEVSRVWRLHYDFVVFIRGKAPPLYSRPPSLAVTSTPFNAAGVRAVNYVSHTEPIFDVGVNSVIYTFNETAKSTIVPIGPPEAAILNETNPNPVTQGEINLANAVAATHGPGSPNDSPPSFATLSERYPGIGQ